MVVGLIEAQCHHRVRCVTSVSGGSILNAALAHGPSLGSFADVEKFEPLASTLAASLAWRGAFAFDWRSLASTGWYLARLIVRAIVPLSFGFAFLVKWLREDLGLSMTDLSQVPWLPVGLMGAVAALVVVGLLSRGLLQEAKYQSVVSAVAASSRGSVKPGLYVREWGAASGDVELGVMHVLVATDLLSGEPMYFSSQFVHCRPYGWSRPEQIRTAEALYSSAAFPAVFPPKRLKLSRLNFQNGEMSGDLPRVVRLVDGGVYNNLGTDWFDVLDDQLRAAHPLLWPFGELKIDPPRIKNVIVVNASAPSRSVRRLGPLTLARIMSVLYDNTVRPRVHTLRGGNRPLIDIDESPSQLAERLSRETGDQGDRAKALVERLKGRTDQFWADFRADTAGTKTKLSRAGRRTGARLMLHGYLSSLVLLHVRFGAELPKLIRGEEYFLSLVRRPGAPTAST